MLNGIYFERRRRETIYLGGKIWRWWAKLCVIRPIPRKLTIHSSCSFILDVKLLLAQHSREAFQTCFNLFQLQFYAERIDRLRLLLAGHANRRDL